MQNPVENVVSLEITPNAPVELSVDQLLQVAGGRGPNDNWTTVAGPNDNWATVAGPNDNW